MRILLFHKGGIGDIVFALPLLRDLAQAHRGAQITVLTHDKGQEILGFCPHLTEILAYGPSGGGWSVLGATKLLKKRFDIAITTGRSLRAAYLLWLVGAPVRVGFLTGPERVFFTHGARIRPFEVVFARRYQRLAEALSIPIGDAIPRLTIPSDQLESARARLYARGWDARSPLIALHIGGGWPTKKWPLENIVEFIRASSNRHGAQVLLQGGPEDLTRAKQITAEVSPNMAIDSVGNRISHAVAEAAQCRVVVGIDSGLTHAAAACGVPVIYLFGPNDPQSIAPSASQHVLTRELPCRPCNRAGRYRCPEGHHRCMRDQDALAVLGLIGQSYLGQRS